MITSAPNPPSDLFERLVLDAGTPRATCGFCQREHIASEGYLEEGELAAFQLKAQLSPGRYKIHACNSVSIGQLNGVNWVEGCECNSAWKYENFIWSHRTMIIEYLKRRAQEQMEVATQVARGVEGL